MTSNQLKWAEISENKRHNLASEQIGSGTLAETTRHNVEWERQNWYTAQAQARYQDRAATAQLAQAAASQSQAGAAWQNAATNAANLAELKRHQSVMESIQQQEADTRSRQAITAMGSLQLERDKWSGGQQAESWSRANLWNTQSTAIPVQTGAQLANAMGSMTRSFIPLLGGK